MRNCRAFSERDLIKFCTISKRSLISNGIYCRTFALVASLGAGFSRAALAMGMKEGVFTLAVARDETGVEVNEWTGAAAAGVGEVAALVDPERELPVLREERGVEGKA